jgi:glutaredoxin-related protein
VKGSYDIEDCRVYSLIGAPEDVESYFDCDSTPITSLEGSPKIVGGFFRCSRTNITDLKGGPEEVAGGYYVSYTTLESFEGAPKRCEFVEIDGSKTPVWNPIHLRDTKMKFLEVDSEQPIYELLNLFTNNLQTYRQLNFNRKKETTERFLESLDYGYIRGDSTNPKVNLFRLREALQEFDLELPTDKDTLEYYTLLDDDGRPVDLRGNYIGIN